MVIAYHGVCMFGAVKMAKSTSQIFQRKNDTVVSMPITSYISSAVCQHDISLKALVLTFFSYQL